MGKREAWHHFLVGATGPEAALIQELNNEDFPRRLTAEVCMCYTRLYTCAYTYM